MIISGAGVLVCYIKLKEEPVVIYINISHLGLYTSLQSVQSYFFNSVYICVVICFTIGSLSVSDVSVAE